jgi:hypothetical protein
VHNCLPAGTALGRSGPALVGTLGSGGKNSAQADSDDDPLHAFWVASFGARAGCGHGDAEAFSTRGNWRPVAFNIHHAARNAGSVLLARAREAGKDLIPRRLLQALV